MKSLFRQVIIEDEDMVSVVYAKVEGDGMQMRGYFLYIKPDGTSSEMIRGGYFSKFPCSENDTIPSALLVEPEPSKVTRNHEWFRYGDVRKKTAKEIYDMDLAAVDESETT
ncbi:MAG: hypothetical protein ISS36_04610 [Candidatus Aenigmarchaeota archaeon]|nr:hypothetical protein [Candidatus Aenigmarchaeota archaeon]